MSNNDKWDVDSPNFSYKKNGYTIHSNVDIGKSEGAVVCTKGNSEGKGAIAISLIDGNTKQLALIHSHKIARLCKEALKYFKEDQGRPFNVSYKAMAIETTLIHAYPEGIGDLLENDVAINLIAGAMSGRQGGKQEVIDTLEGLKDYLYLHCDYADIGEGDTLRKADWLLEILYNIGYVL